MVTPNYAQAQVLAVEGEGTSEIAAGDTSNDATPVDKQGTTSPGMYNPNVCWQCGQVAPPKGSNAIYIKDIKDRSNTPKGCNAMYVEDVEDGKSTYRHIFYHIFLNMVSFDCNAIYVKDVEDRSNTPKGCNAMYVKDVEDGKRTYTHILVHNFLNI